MISLLDTNVIIRFLTADESPKYKTLYSFFQSLEHGQTRVELKLIVLFQVIFILKSFYRLIKEIDRIRQNIGVDRGALIKIWLHERVRQEKADITH